jgi:hypothetical protein
MGLLCVVLLAVTCWGQENSKVEVYGGYSFQNTGISPDLQGTGLPTRLNANGWLGTVTMNVTPALGFKADFGGNYSTMKWDSSSAGLTLGSLDAMKFHSYTFLFGPKLNLTAPGKVRPWADFLAGFGRATMSPSDLAQSGAGLAGVTIPALTDTAFAMKAGGGVDIRLSPSLSSRTEGGWVRTQFNFGGNGGQNNIQVSTGLVVSF